MNLRKIRNPPRPLRTGDRIPAHWLNQIAAWIVQNVSVNGARFTRRGNSLTITTERGRKGGGASDMAMGVITAVTGTSHAAVYDVEALRRSVTLTSAVPYIRPVDSGIDIQEAAVDDWAMLALVHDGGVPYWILWQVPEVIVSGACP